MKNIILAIATATIFLSACTNKTKEKQTDKADESTSEMVTNINTDNTAKVTTTTTEVKPDNSKTVSIKEIVEAYLQLKNALAKDDTKGAADAGNVMVAKFARFNKKGLTTKQVKTYADIEDDAKENAEHIGANAGKLEHQREHFEMLSKDVYDLVKNFGAGQILYYDNCPMYNDGKGANWLSETKEIANPYLGKSMPTCGSIKETLK